MQERSNFKRLRVKQEKGHKHLLFYTFLENFNQYSRLQKTEKYTDYYFQKNLLTLPFYFSQTTYRALSRNSLQVLLLDMNIGYDANIVLLVFNHCTCKHLLHIDLSLIFNHFFRVRAKFKVFRYPPQIGRYTNLKHKQGTGDERRFVIRKT